jgi:hypothetical protein
LRQQTSARGGRHDRPSLDHTTEIIAVYRANGQVWRAQLRRLYPRLRLEFDAIDRDEDRQARMAALEA